jgi:uroporphyrin-III C-methyltransferase/precorrin-2 dehydrogenase/sirohydrochlorin ferrochelatase
VIAVDASGDPETNHLSRRLARAAGIPLNVVDRPAACDFVFPAILDRAPVIVAVSTGGLAPAIARLIRQRLELAIPAGIGCLATLAGQLRSTVAARLTSYRQSTGFWERLFDGGAAQLALAGRIDDAAALADTLIAELETQLDAPAFCTLPIGSDDPDLLTVRTARMIRMADVIIHDPGIAPGILELARRDAKKLAVDRNPSPEILNAHAQGAGLAVYLSSDNG